MDGNKNKLITVFTPTFNRATIIPKLYNSLVNQSFRDFEWIVVDDGSTDNTEAIFKNWVKESVFPIRYIKVQNGGKHRAINLGVNIAQGELFFIVDSDDVLLPDSLELIASKYSEIKDDSQFCGLAGSRGTPPGHRIDYRLLFHWIWKQTIPTNQEEAHHHCQR